MSGYTYEPPQLFGSGANSLFPSGLGLSGNPLTGLYDKAVTYTSDNIIEPIANSGIGEYLPNEVAQVTAPVRDYAGVVLPGSQLPADAPVGARTVEGIKNSLLNTPFGGPIRAGQQAWGLFGPDGLYTDEVVSGAKSVASDIAQGVTGSDKYRIDDSADVRSASLQTGGNRYREANPPASNPAKPAQVTATPEQVQQQQAGAADAASTATAQSPAAIAQSAGLTQETGQELNWFQTIDKAFDLQTLGMNMLANSDSGLSTLANLGKSASASRAGVKQQENLDARNKLEQDKLREAREIANQRYQGDMERAEARNKAMLEVAGIQRDASVSSSSALASVLKGAEAQGDVISDKQRTSYRNRISGYADIDTADEQTSQRMDSLIDSTYSILQAGNQGITPNQHQVGAALDKLMRKTGTVDSGWFSDDLNATNPLEIAISIYGPDRAKQLFPHLVPQPVPGQVQTDVR